MLSHLLNAALLGTAKQTFQLPANTPAVLQQHWQQLAETTAEDRFYQFSALSHAYYHGGQTLGQPQHTAWQTPPVAPSKPDEHMISPALARLLTGWMRQNLHHLTEYAFQQLTQQHYTLPNDSLFHTIGYLQKNPYTQLADYANTTLLGVQGQWLLQQTALIHSLTAADAEEDWTLATFAQRKTWLANTRRTDPDTAREQLQSIWQTASATHRQEYIALMADNLSDKDSDFLTTALKDRSKNVKTIAQRLLLKLPNSPMVQHYQTWLAERLSYHPQQQTWSRHEQPFTADMKAAGIEEVSPQKGESDSAYQLRQLIIQLPLAAWANLLQTDETQAAEILTASPPINKYLDWETWLEEMQDYRFNLAAIRHLNNTAKGRLSYYLARLFMNLNPIDQEALLSHTSFQPLNLVENLHYQQRFTHNTWGECYSHLILDGLKQAKFYLSPETLMQIAIRLNPAPSIAAAIDALPAFIANLPEKEQPYHYHGKWCQQLQEYFQQKLQFDDLLAKHHPA